VRSFERIVALLPRCSSVCLSSVHLGQACIVTIWCTLPRIQVYGWITHCSGQPDTKACLPAVFFPAQPGREVGYVGMDISQERLKIEVKLLFSANRKSYMPRRLAQRRMTLSDLEWPFHGSSVLSVWEGHANVNALCTSSTKSTSSASRAISAV